MGELDYNLISQFVKVTNGKPQAAKDTTVYGTVRLKFGERMVQLDGADSDVYTPVDLSMDAKVGDRVTVLIKDHKAVANADTTTLSARKEYVDAINDHLGATYSADGTHIVESRVDAIDSDIGVIGSTIEAIDSDIFVNESGISVIRSEINAQDSQIGAIRSTIDAIDSDVFLQDSGVSVIHSQIESHNSSILANESNIRIINSVFTIEDVGQGPTITGIHGINAEFASFKAMETDMATIEKLFARSGILGDIIVQDQHLTGTLVGVTILGDSIAANTLIADKLVIRGEDGLFYKLNTENMELDESGDYILDGDGNPIPKEEPTIGNSIHGSTIIAKSVTAEKIAVTDLVAFQATIGGFAIVANAIHSISKPTLDSTNAGIYLGNDGQMNIGDTSNYIKYYKDTRGDFKLDVRANSVEFSGLDDIQNKLGRIEVSPAGVEPYIQLSAEGSDFAIRVSNSQIDFKRGNSTPAWINNQQLHIEQAVIEDELRFGKFVWAQHGSGTDKSMGLMWQGE